MKQLSDSVLADLKQQGHKVPQYRLSTHQPRIGIVHLGPGAFFRGHQAWYTHQAMQQSGGDWGISCVSMRSAGVSEALTPQQGLYTVAVLDENTSYEVVGSIQEVLVAKQQYQAVLQRLANADTQYVTLTITEKGYCLDNNGELDLTHDEIKQDLTDTLQATTAIGLLISALLLRKERGLTPFVVLSCDNLTDNGKKLRAALICYASKVNVPLAIWLEKHLVCPCSMVDSITPATDDALRESVQQYLGVSDQWPIKREAFVQWVIEDCLPEHQPNWQEAGAVFTSDVRGFEHAKLRLLNCPHSTLAYLSVLAGIETVYDAMQEPNLVKFIEGMITREIIPSFSAPKELDVNQYSQEILERFRNPAIRHLVDQIAWDGSQKIPMRILPVIEANLKTGTPIYGLCMALAAWCLFIRKRSITQVELVDPLASKMLAIAAKCQNDAKADVAQFLQLSEVFGTELPSNARFVNELTLCYRTLLPVLETQCIPWHEMV